MKKSLIFGFCFIVGSLTANDAIPIINTVFYGINTLTNLTRPTVVVETPVYAQPAQVVYSTPVVETPVYTVPTTYYYSTPSNVVIYSNGCYYRRPYYRPLPPPPPRYRPAPSHHHRGPRR